MNLAWLPADGDIDAEGNWRPLSETRDCPISFNWEARKAKWLAEMGLPAAPSKDHDKARAAILVQAAAVALNDPRRFISYSRRKAHYTGQDRYQGTAYAFSTVPWAVDSLHRDGWLEHDKAPPWRLGLQSAFRASDQFIDHIQTATPDDVRFALQSGVMLKDANKRPIDFRDTEFTERLEREMAEINEGVRAHHLAPTTGKAEGAAGWVFESKNGEPIAVDLRQDQLQRIFNNGKFTQGGRAARGWWQQLPRADRERLTIDGAPVAEPDIRGCHMQLLYEKAGKQMPEGDPYAIEGWERGQVKGACLIAVNVAGKREGLHAIHAHVIKSAAVGYQRANDLLAAIEKKHAAVAGLLCSKAGMWLMRAESDIAHKVTLESFRAGDPVYSVYDSFITTTAAEGRVTERMDAAMAMMARKLNPDTPTPQPIEALTLTMAEGAQGSFFGPPCIRAADLETWGGGLIPPTIREALRHAARAKGLRQVDAADAVGISRPQLANALQGRFGVSAPVAKRIKDVIYDAMN